MFGYKFGSVWLEKKEVEDLAQPVFGYSATENCIMKYSWASVSFSTSLCFTGLPREICGLKTCLSHIWVTHTHTHVRFHTDKKHMPSYSQLPNLIFFIIFTSYRIAS